MHQMPSLKACWIVLMFAGIVQAQTQLSIRAASAGPVQGWQRMQFENSDRVVWVAPTAAVTATDIERVQPETTPDGRTRIAVVFTDAGAQKIRDLSIAQRNRLIALVVDDRVIWAPTVKSEIGKESVLTGNGPNGLTREEIERIMASFR
jgi:preprotein translocase subunit SecD